jgi:hypothetical protein
MKRILLSALLVASYGVSAQVAQSVDNYIFKYKIAQPYVPLTRATNHTVGKDWTERLVQIPISFNTEIGGKFADKFIFYGNGVGSFGIGSDTAGVVNRFMPIGWEGACDKGAATGVPESPVRYQTDGLSPNRIFKVEMFNTGFFYDCLNPKSIIRDSLNIQFWIYETSNIIEIRYGSHLLTNPSPYYLPGIPIIGYVKEDSLISNSFGTTSTKFKQAYILNGSPGAPIVDSVLTFSSGLTGLSAYPDSGTVYRFIPKAVAASIGETSIAHQFSVYPTLTNDVINVDYSESVVTDIRIFSITGQLMKSTFIKSGNNQIDVSSLASGTYMLNALNADGKVNFKFVKY